MRPIVATWQTGLCCESWLAESSICTINAVHRTLLRTPAISSPPGGRSHILADCRLARRWRPARRSSWTSPWTSLLDNRRNTPRCWRTPFPHLIPSFPHSSVDPFWRLARRSRPVARRSCRSPYLSPFRISSSERDFGTWLNTRRSKPARRR